MRVRASGSQQHQSLALTGTIAGSPTHEQMALNRPDTHAVSLATQQPESRIAQAVSAVGRVVNNRHIIAIRQIGHLARIWAFYH